MKAKRRGVEWLCLFLWAALPAYGVPVSIRCQVTTAKAVGGNVRESIAMFLLNLDHHTNELSDAQLLNVIDNWMQQKFRADGYLPGFGIPDSTNFGFYSYGPRSARELAAGTLRRLIGAEPESWIDNLLNNVNATRAMAMELDWAMETGNWSSLWQSEAFYYETMGVQAALWHMRSRIVQFRWTDVSGVHPLVGSLYRKWALTNFEQRQWFVLQNQGRSWLESSASGSPLYQVASEILSAAK